MTRQIDFENLSDDDKQYLLDRGNSGELRRAGLMESMDYGLTSTPRSLLAHEIDGSPEPTFDLEGEVAKESAGSEPDNPADHVLQPPPQGSVTVVERVDFNDAPVKTAEEVRLERQGGEEAVKKEEAERAEASDKAETQAAAQEKEAAAKKAAATPKASSKS